MAILLQQLNFKKVLLYFFIVLLASCTSNLNQYSNNLLKQTVYASSDYYRSQMLSATNPVERNDFALLTVRTLIKENKLGQATTLLNSLVELNNDEQKLEKVLLQATLATAQHQDQTAQTLLTNLNLNQLSNAQKSRYYQLLSQLDLNQRNYLGAIQALIQSQNLTNDLQQKQQNNDQIWAILRQIPQDQLNSLTTSNNNLELQGWLELIKLYNDNISQPAQLNIALQQWKLAHPRHIATYLLPTELQRVSTFQQINLHQIALILPLSGNGKLIGQTIEQGFLAAKGNSPITVKIYDSQQENISQLIAKAKQEGADAIVGPLLKSEVNSLVQQANLNNLTVLALNTTTNPQNIPQLCYFALAPEDEATDAAKRIWLDNHHTPMVLVPQSNLGRRIATAFNTQWRNLSGYDAQINYYDNDDNANNALISTLPPSPETNDKDNKKPVIPTPVPAPNDAIYAPTVNASQLQQLKTSLDNSVVAGQVALYASSRSHSPNTGVDYRLGMNGVKFSDIPLLSDTNSTDYQTVIKNTNGDYSLARLYAMGADAWNLINHQQALRAISGYSLDGLTGKLSADNACQIKRQLTWYLYDNGNLKTIN